MNQAEIQKIIQSGESERVEFKQSFSEELIETIVAFSNSSGGTIFVGINNQGEIIGIQIGKETLQKWTNEIKNKTSPSQIVDISEIEIEAKTICQIKVNEYPVKPVSFKGRYYKRVKNSNHQLSAHEISEIHLQSLQL
jgi:ATP-dependent DNA helicase RecG